MNERQNAFNAEITKLKDAQAEYDALNGAMTTQSPQSVGVLRNEALSKLMQVRERFNRRCAEIEQMIDRRI